jgi:hypothetical protein
VSILGVTCEQSARAEDSCSGNSLITCGFARAGSSCRLQCRSQSRDWIKYGQFTVNWTGNGTEPSYITEEKKTQWVRIDVENVSGTTITFNLTTQFNNGTQTPQTLTVNVATNSMNGFFFIASNLKSGDRLTNGTISSIINQTTTGTYAGATRNVNVVNITTTSLGYLTITSRICWDQTTGIMVEAYTKAPDYGSPTPGETVPSA